ncbi:MAG: D-glycero-beta-D-manno-heptose-7-phosphate kinase [Smithellaceae bacterium]|nr:D-glycero-beta-D-manno-heptose-7-phosphate kinase [Smithellaceae bacterium]
MERAINKKRALEIIDKFSSARVLVVGDIIIDQFIWGRVSRISPEAPVPVVDVHDENLRLGGCANVMHNICSIGGGAGLAGVVGADEASNLLLKELARMNIDRGGVVIEPSRPTTMKTRIIAHGQQMVRFDREMRSAVTDKSIEDMLRYIDREMERGLGAIIVSDYNKGVVSEVLLAGIRKRVAGKKIHVCVDPKRNDLSFYQGVDIITPNHHEASRALGIPEVNEEMNIEQIGMELLRRYDFRAVLVTRGEDGMSLFEKQKRFSHTTLPAKAKEVYDVTGAGDTVIAVFALAVAAGASYREAAYLANHAAGIVVGKLGTATISQLELKKSL